jgi:hypothetical protein
VKRVPIGVAAIVALVVAAHLLVIGILSRAALPALIVLALLIVVGIRHGALRRRRPPT